ncbi:phosphate-starvation-inducible protein PsiE [Neobacillus sp. SAB-20_R2A]|uniref:phosphate-starvation-inducible protein PsiE n=1 Tax=Neobacillus sp. SAB-20_R2A TaxID=3120519 RepID=UPI003C6E30EF
MEQVKKNFNFLLRILPRALQLFLNVTLVLLATILAILLVKELLIFGRMLMDNGSHDHQQFFANILLFFLYFEFIAMIVKYFKEQYHFPIRYFLYIGITAMIRLIIVEHDSAINTLINALVILILIIGYFLLNLTPRERPERVWRHS